MAALLVGAAPLAQTPEPAQDDSIEAIRTRAEAGDADAQFELGLMYARGERVPAPVAAQAGFPTKRVEPFRFLSDATWNELAGRYTED